METDAIKNHLINRKDLLKKRLGKIKKDYVSPLDYPFHDALLGEIEFIDALLIRL